MFNINATRILTNHRLCYKISATVIDTPMLNFSTRSVFTVIHLIDYKTSFNLWTDTLASGHSHSDVRTRDKFVLEARESFWIKKYSRINVVLTIKERNSYDFVFVFVFHFTYLET